MDVCSHSFQMMCAMIYILYLQKNAWLSICVCVCVWGRTQKDAPQEKGASATERTENHWTELRALKWNILNIRQLWITCERTCHQGKVTNLDLVSGGSPQTQLTRWSGLYQLVTALTVIIGSTQCHISIHLHSPCSSSSNRPSSTNY